MTCGLSLLAGSAWAATPAVATPESARTNVAIVPHDAAALRAQIQQSAGIYDVLAGELYAQRRDLARAYAYMMDGARRTGDTRLYARAAEFALRARMPDAALKAVQNWKNMAPQDAEADSFQLQIMILLGKLTESAPALERALANVSADKRPAMIHAIPTLYSKAQNPRQTLRIVEKALAPYGGQPEAAFVSATTLARMHLMARQFPQAMAALQTSNSAEVPSAKLGALLPNREIPAVIALDVLRMARGSAPDAAAQAETLIRSAVQRSDASPELQLAYAQTLIELRRYNDSLTQLRQLVQRHPDNAMAWLLQGSIQVQNKQWSAADTTLQHYLKLRAAEPAGLDLDGEGEADVENRATRLLQRVTAASSDIQAYLMLAEVADARNDTVAASQWVQRIQPASVRNTAMLQRAEMLSRKGKHTQALLLASGLPTATEQDRTIKALLESRIEEKAGNTAAAVTILTRALTQNKDDAELLYARGALYDKLGKAAESEQDLRRVIALKPDSPAAYNALGYGLADRSQRLPEAKALIEKALAMDPENAAIQDSLGWVEYRLGNLHEARNWLQQAFTAEPQSEIAAHLGEVLWKLGEQDKARAIWQHGLMLDAADAVLRETIKRLTGAPAPRKP